jgi:N-acetylglucosamine kinase-like BadF-type ATPase
MIAALRRTLWAYDGQAEKTGLTAALLTRFNWVPPKLYLFAAKAARPTTRGLLR